MKCPQCGINNRDNAQYCLGCGRKLAATSQAESIVAPPKAAKPKKRESLSPQTIQKGRYLVIQKLGAGGMSRVYLARDTKMDCNVVVKEMFPPKNYPEKKEYFLSKFKNEAKLLFRMRHPGIPRVTDYFAEGDNYYMVMEYIEGENMDIIMKNRPDHRITTDEFFGWLGRLLEIIQFLHNQDPPIYHRDIKPANFMLDSRGQVFLVDFGVAKAISLEEAHTRIGTIGYASPEHFTGKFVKSSDLYSLAASFHFMLSGDDPRFRLPFDFPPISVYRQDLPSGVEAMLVKMLEKDSNTRFQDTESLRQEFLEIFKLYKEKGVVPSPPVAPRPAADDSGSLDKTEQTEEADESSLVQKKTGKLSIPILKRTRRIPKPLVKKTSKEDDTDFVEEETDTPVPEIIHPVPEEKKEQTISYEIKKPAPPQQKPVEERTDVLKSLTSASDSSAFKPVVVIKHPEPPPKREEIYKTGEKQEQRSPERPKISQVSTGPKQQEKPVEQIKTDKQSLFSSRMGTSRTPSRQPETGNQGPSYAKQEDTKAVTHQEPSVKPLIKTPVISISKTDLPERPKDKKKQKQMQSKPETVIKIKDQDDDFPSDEIPEAVNELEKTSSSASMGKKQEESSKIRIMTFIIILLTVLLLFVSLYVVNRFIGERKNKPAEQPKPTYIMDKQEQAIFNEARQKVSSGDYDAAIKKYSEIIEKNPGNPDAYFERGMVFLNNKNEPGNAEADLQKYSSLAGEQARVFLLLTKASLMKNEDKEAVKQFAKAQALDVNAADLFRDILKTDKKSTTYINELSEEYFNAGRKNIARNNNAEALKCFDIIGKLKPDNTIANKAKAQQLLITSYDHSQNGRFEEAKKDIEQSLSLAPQADQTEIKNAYSKILENHARYMYGLNNFSTARTNLELALKNDAGNYDARILLAQSNLALKKYKEAISECNLLISKKQRLANAYFIRGGAYYELNDDKRAKQDWKTAQKLAKPGSDLALKAEQNLQLIPAK